MADSVKVNIVGDICIKQLYNHKIANTLKKKLGEADLNVINLESPCKHEKSQPIHKSGPNHYQDNKIPLFLESNGFNVIAMANNHIMDYGSESLLSTINSFSSASTIGVGSCEEAYNVKVLTINGIRIGFLSITQFEFGVLDDKAIENNQIGAAWLGYPKVDELIMSAHNICDFLIVIPHIGCEYFDFPLPEVRTLFRHYITIGADAVVGGHPHVPQCWETYKNKPIIYSMGNFCFDVPNRCDYWYKGLMVCLVFTNNNISYNIEMLEYDFQERSIDITSDKVYFKHLIEVNETFKNEDKYLSIVNDKCLQLEKNYMKLFEYSGYYRPQLKRYLKISLGIIKQKLLLRHGQIYSETHFINNIRCETHRWILSRIYQLKN